MLSAILVALILIVGLAFRLLSRQDGELISRRPYNNRYSDASGARDDHFV